MKQPQILIVEDEAIVALDIQQRLVAHGYAVVGTAATGARAIELAEQHRPDLVLMDIRLQGPMDGITAAEEIRNRFHRPVVFLTAFSEEATLQRAKLVEPFGYILKPFEDRELKTIIEIALYKHQADEQIRRLNRLYTVLSRVNQAVVRVQSATELWTAVCRIVVEQGGCKLAWFGRHDASSKRILPVAQFGEPQEFVQPLNTAIPAAQADPGPASTALREDRDFICNHIASDARATAWAAAAQTAGFSSAAGFRLVQSGAVVGVLTLYAAPRDYFQAHERILLEEVVADVQFALSYLQKDKLRQLAETETRHQLKFETHLASISMRFVGEQDFDSALADSLEEIGQFLGIDRTFVLQLRPDWSALDQTHEWCGTNGTQRKNQLQNLPTTTLCWSLRLLMNGENVNLRDLGKLPAAATVDHPGLHQLAGKTLLLLPLLTGNRLLGAVGFATERMARDWTDNETQLLRMLANLISRVLSHRATQRAVRVTEERFQAFMANTPTIVWAKDQDGRYVYLNQAFEIQFGVTLRHWFGKTAAEVWPAKLAHEIAADDQKVMATGIPLEFIQTTETASSQKRHWLCTKFRFTDEDGHYYLGGMGFDVTEKNQLEVELFQAQKMETIGSMAAGIAHDFNNLLCVVLGFGEIALKTMKPVDPLYQPVTQMKEAAQRAAVLARRLLTLTRKEELDPQLIDLNKILTTIRPTLEQVVRGQIELTVAPGLVPPVKVDPGQIEQVIMNMVINARDAMPSGGQLQIATTAVKLAEPVASAIPPIAPGQYVRLDIRDTGSGMTDAVKAQIFEPFFTTKPAGQGTGLGLATSARIIQKFGGHIAVESAVGAGTTFQLYFPTATDGTAAGPVEQPAEPAARGSETILFVEDNEVIREMASLMLESEGYQVITAADGEDALRVLVQKAAGINLLISNIVMPKMGGAKLIAAVQRDYPRLKILITSGYEKNTAESQGILTALGGFLQKPYTATSLANAVRKILDEPARPA